MNSIGAKAPIVHPLKYGNFRINGFNNNSCFQDSRDDCLSSFIALREKLLTHGIELNTSDVNFGKEVVLEIHVDVQKDSQIEAPIFLLQYETELVNLLNVNLDSNLHLYEAVFTWNDSAVKTKKYLKFHLPVHRPELAEGKEFIQRSGFCCAISANKAIRYAHESEMYSKRVDTYLWFENHSPEDFDLYGVGWENPPVNPGTIGRVISKFYEFLPAKFGIFKRCYKGKVAAKSDVFGDYKFSICYENFVGLDGYISEKIFDSMFSGCVPVYWGAKNIGEYVPSDCFIDRRDFKDEATLYEFLKSVDVSKFNNYQQAIITFLDSDSAKKFYKENYVDTISSVILNRLSGQ